MRDGSYNSPLMVQVPLPVGRDIRGGGKGGSPQADSKKLQELQDVQKYMPDGSDKGRFKLCEGRVHSLYGLRLRMSGAYYEICF